MAFCEPRGVTIGGAGFFVPKKNICAGKGGVAVAVSDIVTYPVYPNFTV